MRLLLTDNAASAHRQRLHHVSEHVDIVRLSELEGAGPTPIDAAFFSPDCYPDLAAAFMVAVLEAPGLSWLHTFSAGTDHPIFATLIDRGVRVTNSSGGSAVPISHAVVMHPLALSRRLPETIDNQRRRQWSRLGGRDLQNSTTVILGYGPIGQAVAQLVPAFGSHVIALRRNVDGTEPLPTDSPLWDLPNVIVTPHIAARTPSTDTAAVDMFLTNLTRLIGGEELLNEIK